MTDRDQLTDFQKQALLLEYDKLKDESTERIKARDNFVYLNVASIGLIVSFAGDTPSKAVAYLAVPWIATGFGWLFLMNDEKISGLSRYTRYHVAPLVGSDSFGWESRFKRRTRLKKWHKWGQFVSDLLMFVAPTVVGLLAFHNFGVPSVVTTVVTVIETVAALALTVMIAAHSPITDRWDYSREEWRTGVEQPKSGLR